MEPSLNVLGLGERDAASIFPSRSSYARTTFTSLSFVDPVRPLRVSFEGKPREEMITYVIVC